jgi:2-keto-4-pentenoate hydratase/2-oxohepta-3-ene-1,7-dioic acid hydratase in catechol pathway
MTARWCGQWRAISVIGKAGRRIPRSEALGHIAGLTLMNEGTIRDWVRHAKFNVTQGKNFDRSGSIGPWMVTSDELNGFDDISLQTRVNGELRQDDSSRNFIFGFDVLIEYISSFATLNVGDIISTGTPPGAGARFDPPRFLKPGDIVEITSPQIGTLSNGVADG